VAAVDPFPQVAGRGIAGLRAAGIEVVLGDDDLRTRAQELNIGFYSRVVRGRPWTRLKTAISLDGRTALPSGESRWITGPSARADGHAWRRRAGTVVTGVGTVLADDPSLDVRLVPSPRPPQRVIVDSHLRTPPDARVLKPPGRAWVATTSGDAERRARLEAAGAELIDVAAGADRRVALAQLLAALAGRSVNELHVEAGATLTGAFVKAGLADELLVYLAPALLGDGRGLASLGPLQDLDRAWRGRIVEVGTVGDDLRLRVRVEGATAWLPRA
jgi:diaminohydroxyphosphoribosylaminopyrimidine deaminase/5-amino-6-(5-phosphoribosylamino)uracil reductase